MHNDILVSLTRLSDVELVGRLRALIVRERDAAAEIVAHLAEMETRDLHLREGYGSLYLYCRDALGLSEWEAYNRIEVARTARQFPVILEMLAEGCVSLTAVRLLSPHLTPENHRDLLASARGKRKLQVQEMVAALAPRPDVPSSVRRVAGSDPQLTALTIPNVGPLSLPIFGQGPGFGAPVHPDLNVVSDLPRPDSGVSVLNISAATPTRPQPAASLTALSPNRYKLQVTISGETLERLRLAKDMLGHAIPSGDDAAVLDRALVALLAELARKKFADASERRTRRAGTRPVSGGGVATGGAVATSRAVATSGAPAKMLAPASRRPPAAVKRAVWLRDLGRCAFVGTTGHRCNERRFVEFHHVDPYALGGEATVDGIQLRCRRHNDYEGRLYFGERRRIGCVSTTTASSASAGVSTDVAGAASELVPEQVRLRASRTTA
jgi:hypothetical protein